ncbi:MAG TPA: conjugal transfer protein TrbI, partial [Hyphomicrobium zavarzinii]|nr:conjugal transfer protein TrbI [Hyphomicrobium zavarzinii]
MVQSLKLGGEAAEPKIRRINRLPIVIAIVLIVAFLAVIIYGLSSRGLYFSRNPSIEQAGGAPASTYADQLKRGVSDGIIGDPAEAPVFQPTPPERTEPAAAPKPAVVQPERATAEGEPDAVWRARLKREADEQYYRELQRQRMARMQATDTAYDSPIAVNVDKLRSNARSDPAASQ